MAAHPTQPPYAQLEHIGVRELKSRLSGVLDRTVRRGRSALVTNHNRPDAVLLPPAEYEVLIGERARREQLSGVVAMLLAAVSTGVKLPSETLEQLDLGPAELDWRALNAFQARYPVAITHDEEGRPLPAADVALEHIPVVEGDEELELG